MKKAQAWGIDLMIATMIFAVGIATFYLYTINSQKSADSFTIIKYDGDFLAESIFSQGSPADWNSLNVQKIGIIDDGIINQTKLENFYNLALSDYTRTKILFNTKYDYFFLIENMTINSSIVPGIGKPVNLSLAKNLVKITRFTIYQNKPSSAYIYIWEE